MSKVTIRFFDKKANEYVARPAEWILDQDLDCYQWNGDKNQYEWNTAVEPHFFVNGERIA